MTDTSEILRSALFQTSIGQPSEDSGLHEHTSRIDALVHLVEEWEMGGVATEKVLRAFDKFGPKGFDFVAWAQDQIASGSYGEDALMPSEPEDDPTPTDNVVAFPR